MVRMGTKRLNLLGTNRPSWVRIVRGYETTGKHLPNLAKEIQGILTGKGLASSSFTSFPVFGLSTALNPMTRNFSFS